eukprot:scaffold874_cov380-Prasinococcus_capsulatus_cf.AAC.1
MGGAETDCLWPVRRASRSDSRVDVSFWDSFELEAASSCRRPSGFGGGVVCMWRGSGAGQCGTPRWRSARQSCAPDTSIWGRSQLSGPCAPWKDGTLLQGAPRSSPGEGGQGGVLAPGVASRLKYGGRNGAGRKAGEGGCADGRGQPQ